MNVTLISIDLAKSIFQVCGVNSAGKPVFNRQVRRSKLMTLLLQYPEAVIAMEACSGSNYWGRELKKRCYTVMLIPPQHVKPFVKGNKNDRNDAFAITEAARRPGLHCVEPRTLEQTGMIQVHRQRQRRVNQRTALINQIRGFLNEYGIVFRQGKEYLLSELPELLDEPDERLPASAQMLFKEMLAEWCDLNEAIKALDKRITQQAKANEDAFRLMQVRGVGDKIATAMVAYAGNGSAFRNGRHCAANLGVVPREHSSGGVQKLGGVTKRGNAYLRRLLVQGAWSVIRHADKSDDRLSRWARQVIARRGKHKAALAVANKLARILWSMLYHKTEYQSA